MRSTGKAGLAGAARSGGATAQPGESVRLMEIPAGATVATNSPFKIGNRLAGHPLFEPERIKKLLRTAPRESVEIRAVELLGTHDGTFKRGPLLTNVDPVETFPVRLSDGWVEIGLTGSLARERGAA